MEWYPLLLIKFCSGFHRKIAERAQKIGIRFVMKKGTTLASVLCKLKQKTEKAARKNMDYIILKYVGETRQQFHTPNQLHQGDVKNRVSTHGIYIHLKHNKKHRIA